MSFQSWIENTSTFTLAMVSAIVSAVEQVLGAGQVAGRLALALAGQAQYRPYVRSYGTTEVNALHWLSKWKSSRAATSYAPSRKQEPVYLAPFQLGFASKS